MGWPMVTVPVSICMILPVSVGVVPATVMNTGTTIAVAKDVPIPGIERI